MELRWHEEVFAGAFREEAFILKRSEYSETIECLDGCRMLLELEDAMLIWNGLDIYQYTGGNSVSWV